MKKASDRSFEEALRRLEEVVRLLENGEVPLEEALHLFSEGVELARHCHGVLDRAEQRLQVIDGDGMLQDNLLEGDDRI